MGVRWYWVWIWFAFSRDQLMLSIFSCAHCLTVSFSFNHLFKNPVSKYNYISRVLGVRTETYGFGGDTLHVITNSSSCNSLAQLKQTFLNDIFWFRWWYGHSYIVFSESNLSKTFLKIFLLTKQFYSRNLSEGYNLTLCRKISYLKYGMTYKKYGMIQEDRVGL